MDLVADRIFESYREFEGVGSVDFDKFIQGQIEADSEYQKLKGKQEELNAKVEEYRTRLGSAKGRQAELNTSLGQAKNEQANVNKKLEDAKKKADNFKEKMKEVSQHTKKVSVENLGISKTLGSSIKKLAKFGVALLGFQGIYSLLKSSMSEWLNGSSKEAKQLQADISNLKANIGAALAPAIQSVLQIFYKILAVVGAIVKAFSNINIFAKKTAKSTASTASSTKQASNNLASFDNLDVLQKDNNSSGGGTGDLSPTDLSSLMKQYEELAEKIKDIFGLIFEPFKKAWETTGQSVMDAIKNAFNGIKSLCEAVGGSFAKIWTNGTVQTTAELLLKLFADILNIIGNIAQALANAWNKDNMGDQLVQSLANAFNNLLYIIESVFAVFEEWTSSDSFQTFANSIMSILATLGSWIEKITQALKEIWDGAGKETFSKLLEAFSKVGEAVNAIIQFLSPVIDWIISTVKPIIMGIVEALGFVFDALGGLLDFITGVFTGDWEKAWQGIKDFFARNMECNMCLGSNYMGCNLFYNFICYKYNKKCNN